MLLCVLMSGFICTCNFAVLFVKSSRLKIWQMVQGCVEIFGAVQAPAARLTMTQKEKLLPEFAEEGWLAHVPGQHGKYSMGVSMPGTHWSSCFAPALMMTGLASSEQQV